MMKKSLFITFEGGDGSGKSTQINKVKEFLEGKGVNVLLTREPGGSAVGEKIREIILDKENSEIHPITEAMLYAASRAQLVQQVIKPALSKGITVICDRFVDSSVAYQGYGRGLGDTVKSINRYAVDDCMPDITFLMKLDPEVGKGRIVPGQEDRLELEKLDFHQKVFFGYEQIEKAYPERIVGIDASGSIEDIFGEIRRCLERLIDDK